MRNVENADVMTTTPRVTNLLEVNEQVPYEGMTASEQSTLVE